MMDKSLVNNFKPLALLLCLVQVMQHIQASGLEAQPIQVGTVPYKAPQSSLHEASCDEIIAQLIENTDNARELLKSLESSLGALTAAPIKERLLTTHKVLFCTIFKKFLKTTTLPLDTAVAGAFTSDGQHIVLINCSISGDEPANYAVKYRLQLWSLDQLIRDVGTASVLDEQEVILKGYENKEYPSINIVGTAKGTRFFIAGYHSCQIWQITESYKLIHEKTLIGNDRYFANSIAPAPNGSSIIAPQGDREKPQLLVKLDELGRVKEIDERDLALVGYEIGSQNLKNPSIGGNGRWIVALNSSEQEICLWRIDDNGLLLWKRLKDMVVDGEGIYHVSLSHSAKYILYSSENKKVIRLLDSETGMAETLHARLKWSQAPSAECLTFSSNERFAYFAITTQPSILYDLEQKRGVEFGEGVKSYICSAGNINKSALSPDLNFVVQISGGTATLIHLYWPMNTLSLSQLILICQLDKHGADLLKKDHDKAILESMPHEETLDLCSAVKHHFIKVS